MAWSDACLRCRKKAEVFRTSSLFLFFFFCDRNIYHTERLCLRQEYITHVDPMTQLGLSSDSVQGYNIGEIHRPSGGAAPTPELLPCGYLVGDSNTISIQLKGDSLKKKMHF